MACASSFGRSSLLRLPGGAGEQEDEKKDDDTEV
jgi:hypothetical protein